MSTTAADQINTSNNSNSINTFTSSLFFNVIVSSAIFVGYNVVRLMSKNIYQPRTFMIDHDKRPPSLTKSPLQWVWTVVKTPDEQLLKRVGVDAYMFLRYIRLCLVLFGLFSIPGFLILMPVNAINQEGLDGLNKLTFGNIKDPRRLWVHLFFNYLFTGVTLYAVKREMNKFILFRQKYLLSAQHQLDPIANTILVSGIPDETNTEEKLKKLFDPLPGGVKQVFIVRRVEELKKLVKERNEIISELELVFVRYGVNRLKNPNRIVSRPTHRVGFWLFGKKVDSIDYYSRKLRELNVEISEKQSNPSNYRKQASAFISFNNQLAAHIAVQSVSHHLPLAMYTKYVDMKPEDINWENLNIFPFQRYIRRGLSLAATVCLIMFWVFPVTFVSSLASLSSLIQILPFLSFMQSWSPVLIGIIQGIVPAVLLSLLVALLPIIFRALCMLEGTIRKSDVEQSVMTRFFVFLLINVFLVTTFASGIFSALGDLVKNPISSVTILGKSLPKVSTFFVTYVLFQALVGAAQEMLQVNKLVFYYIKTVLQFSTPRKVLDLNRLTKFEFGTTFPEHTLIFVIGLTYSTVAPFILLFVCLYFLIYYFVFHHQFQYVYDSVTHQTGGLLFPKAMEHMVVGIFFFQLTSLGLIMAKGGVIQAVGMVLLVIITTGLVRHGNRGFHPLLKFLPINISQKPALIGLESELTIRRIGKKTTFSHGSTFSEQSPFSTFVSPLEDTMKEESGELEIHTVIDYYTQSSPSSPISSQKPDSRLPSYRKSLPGNLMFLNPVLRDPMPVLWLPSEDSGILQVESTSLSSHNIPVTTRGAQMSPKGKIRITRWKDPTPKYWLSLELKSFGIHQPDMSLDKRTTNSTEFPSVIRENLSDPFI
ncbi:phosphate metabolism protein 7 [Basidiobolus ranarum]|uniref:Phosphate metabolism protein 7 n=1 Tax=Basidiobolus ranarum TaxID=34480 RepID=A0ABR2WHB5_9FUNG